MVFKDYYKIEDDFSLEAIALSRNWIVKNSQPDTVRTAVMVLTDFRAGRIGRFVFGGNRFTLVQGDRVVLQEFRAAVSDDGFSH